MLTCKIQHSRAGTTTVVLSTLAKVAPVVGPTGTKGEHLRQLRSRLAGPCQSSNAVSGRFTSGSTLKKSRVSWRGGKRDSARNVVTGDDGERRAPNKGSAFSTAQLRSGGAQLSVALSVESRSEVIVTGAMVPLTRAVPTARIVPAGGATQPGGVAPVAGTAPVPSAPPERLTTITCGPAFATAKNRSVSPTRTKGIWSGGNGESSIAARS